MKKFLWLLFTGLCFCVACFGLSGCFETESAGDPMEEARKIYALYSLYAENRGENPVSYEEWLASIVGEKGEPGEKGEKGDAGRGIERIEAVCSTDDSDNPVMIFTFYYSEGEPQVVSVPLPAQEESPVTVYDDYTVMGGMRLRLCADGTAVLYDREGALFGSAEWKKEADATVLSVTLCDGETAEGYLTLDKGEKKGIAYVPSDAVVGEYGGDGDRLRVTVFGKYEGAGEYLAAIRALCPDAGSPVSYTEPFTLRVSLDLEGNLLTVPFFGEFDLTENRITEKTYSDYRLTEMNDMILRLQKDGTAFLLLGDNVLAEPSTWEKAGDVVIFRMPMGGSVGTDGKPTVDLYADIYLTLREADRTAVHYQPDGAVLGVYNYAISQERDTVTVYGTYTGAGEYYAVLYSVPLPEEPVSIAPRFITLRVLYDREKKSLTLLNLLYYFDENGTLTQQEGGSTGDITERHSRFVFDDIEIVNRGNADDHTIMEIILNARESLAGMTVTICRDGTIEFFGPNLQQTQRYSYSVDADGNYRVKHEDGEELFICLGNLLIWQKSAEGIVAEIYFVATD